MTEESEPPAEACVVENCENDSTIELLCDLHRRKQINGGLEYEDGLVWDTCAQGHRWTKANTHIESNSKGGRRRRCRACLSLRSKRRRLEPSNEDAPHPVRLRDPMARRAVNIFDLGKEILDPKCAGEYEKFADYNKDTVPTKVEAEALCSGCPFIKACANNAYATLPAWGVWGGEVWTYGVPWNGDKRRLHVDD